jgi:ankyrin repeat protein
MRFAFCGDVEMVKYLIEDCHVDLYSRDPNGGTCFHYAAAQGQHAVLHYLLNKSGSKDEVFQLRDNFGVSVSELHQSSHLLRVNNHFNTGEGEASKYSFNSIPTVQLDKLLVN